jgi:hypothetical protein
MQDKCKPIPTNMDQHPADLSCDRDDSPAEMWCNTEQELAALRSFVSVVLSSECVDECLPLSEPLDDLCLFSGRNLRILKEALEEPGAIGGHNTYFEGDTRSTEISFVSPDCKRAICGQTSSLSSCLGALVVDFSSLSLFNLCPSV